MKPTNQQKHDAGRHSAVAEALLRGYSAKIKGRVTYIEVTGRTAVVMVNLQGVWMIADIDKFEAMTAETYVLVNLTGGRREFYIVPGAELRRLVQERHRQFMAKVGTRPRNPESRQTKIEPYQVVQWQDKWSAFDQTLL